MDRTIMSSLLCRSLASFEATLLLEGLPPYTPDPSYLTSVDLSFSISLRESSNHTACLRTGCRHLLIDLG